MLFVSRSSVLRVAVGAAFAAAAATIFVLGDARDGSVPYFLLWLAVHVLYGIVSGSFWSLLIVLVCPPLLIAGFRPGGAETPLWLEAAFIEVFYGLPLAFMGVVTRRLWRLRHPGLEEQSE